MKIASFIDFQDLLVHILSFKFDKIFQAYSGA
jgi:hypothetical protein